MLRLREVYSFDSISPQRIRTRILDMGYGTCGNFQLMAAFVFHFMANCVAACKILPTNYGMHITYTKGRWCEMEIVDGKRDPTMRGLGHGNGELATNNTRKVLFRFDFAFPYCSSFVGHSWVFISFSLIAYIWRFVVEFPISNFVFLCWWVGISLSKQNSFGYRLLFPPMEIGIGTKKNKQTEWSSEVWVWDLCM